MFKSYWNFLVCCLLLGGCATLPTEAVDHVSLAAVEERVKCEIGYAYRTLRDDSRFPDLSRWSAGLTLSLSVDSTGGIAPSTSLTGPFGNVGPIDVSLGASLNAKRTALLNVYVAFVEAARHLCPPASPILIEGRLGLAEWIIRVFEAQLLVDQATSSRSVFNNEKSIGYSMDFLITLSAGATPNFVIANTTGSKFGASLESKSTHSVDIAMVEMAPSDFQKRFKTVRIPGKIIEIDNPDLSILKIEPNGITNPPAKIKIREPDTVVTKQVGVDVSVGPETKFKLDQVLIQLNNKVLIQSLRR